MGPLDPFWPFHYQLWVVLLPAFVGLVIFAAYAFFSFRLTVAELKTRRGATFAVLPTDDCDPTPQRVDWFARQMGGTPQPVNHWLFWRATAYRIEMRSKDHGKVAYLVQVTDKMVPALRTSWAQIDGAQLVPLDQLPGAPIWEYEDPFDRSGRARPRPFGSPTQVYAANAEMRLGGPGYEPLAIHDLTVTDPKQSFAEVFGRLRDDLGERASVCIDLRPVPTGRKNWLRGYWLGKAGGKVAQGSLSEPETSRLSVGNVVGKRQDTNRLTAKLDPEQIFYEAQILIHVASADTARAVEIIRSFLSSFQQWKGANDITVRGNLLGASGYDIRFFGVDAFRWRRWFFRLRLETGLWWPRHAALVVAWEIAGLLTPWTRHNTSRAPIRAGEAAASPTLSEYAMSREFSENELDVSSQVGDAAGDN